MRDIKRATEDVAAGIHDRRVVIIGAGPAGLTAAHELAKQQVPFVILEADNVVGGLARTVNYKGYLFDIGGHRFFSKWDEVNAIWNDVLGDKLLTRPRLSRILYRQRYFQYPLKAREVLFGLGAAECVRIVCSYLKACLFRSANEDSLEQWVSNRFGRRLYEVFFKTYTEKVWGISCAEIRSEWAEQRIRGLSLASAVRNAILLPRTAQPKTLINSFQYPERGPGQMWEAMTSRLRQLGGEVLLERSVAAIVHDENGVNAVETQGPQGLERHTGTHFISSMPIRDLVNAINPPPPDKVRMAATRLHYRDFLIVSLIIDRQEVMPDNWLYIHDPGVRVGRIQNFKNWSPAMVPDPKKTCLGMEYFVFQKDDLWTMDDASLIQLAARELEVLGLARRTEVNDGEVVRMAKAYPIYDAGYQEHISIVRQYIEANLPNLQLVGRNGMHKYNNQDHSMITALYAVRNILGGDHDLWAINTEPEYHEEGRSESEVRDVVESPLPPYAEPPQLATPRHAAGVQRPRKVISE